MRTYLRIGEVAQLLGITTKTIRHYHKVGLLAEPQRTQAEYRLYTARDVLRILQIRRLQGLGLSLAQIKRILVEPEEEGSLRRVLEHIAAEIDEQIRQLEMRRERIGALLAEATLDALDHPQETPQIVEMARARLAEQGIVPDEAAWKRDRAIFGTLDALHLPGDAQQQLHQAMRRVMDDPEQTRRIVAIGERFASLAGEAADSPRVTLLVEEALGSGWLDQLQQFQHFHAGEHRSDDNRDLLGTLLTEIIAPMLSPAQQRFLEIIREWQGVQEPLHEGK
jgi:DNA-binding transcriptional MerR regulator